MDYIELGKRIRQQRRSLELTQDALAHEVGVTAAIHRSHRTRNEALHSGYAGRHLQRTARNA